MSRTKEDFYKPYTVPDANKWNYLVDRFYGQVPEQDLKDKITHWMSAALPDYLPDARYGPDPDENFDPQDCDENLRISPANIEKFFVWILEQGVGDLDDPYKEYDVENFKADVINYPWWMRFNTLDPEFLVNFNEALMLLCHSDYRYWNIFGLSGQIIMFSDLSDWANKEF